MKRFRIVIVTLFLASIILLTWLATTESGLHWTYRQAEPYFSGKVTITKMEGKLLGPITFTGIEYQQDGALIKANTLIFDWLPVALMVAKINISRLHIQSLEIVLPEAEKTNQVQKQEFSLPDINLPWRVALKDVLINDFNLSQDEQTFKVQQISLNASTALNVVEIKNLNINADTFKLDIQGELHPTQNYPHDLKIQWQGILPNKTMIKGQGQVTGNMRLTHLQQTLNEPLKLTLDAQGDFTTSTLSGMLKGEHSELGTVDANFKLQRLSDNSIQIDQLKLHAPHNDTHLDANGQWEPGDHGGNIKLALNWQNLRWPMHDPPWFNSAHGNGSIEGNIDHYKMKLTTDSPWPQAAPSTWIANAEGNLDGLNFHSLRVIAMKNEAIATGQLNWSPELAWKAEANATDINPASHWPQWPGQLNAKLTSDGRFVNNQLIANVDITQLKGTLRSYPVSLHSRLSWSEEKLDIALFELLSGGTQVNLQGQAGDIMKLDWSIDSSNLGELYPKAKGQLKSKGQLTGSRFSPKIDASFHGKAISLPDVEIGVIDGTIAADLMNWQQVDIKLLAQSLKLNDYILQSLDINADSQYIEAKAVSDAATARVVLKGKADTKGWSGRLERADIQSSQFADWQLITPATLDISDKISVIDPLCWHNNQGGKLCASFKRDNMAWSSSVEMNKVPLILFSHWLPPELKLDGVADATAELQFQPPDQLFGQAHIELPLGSVSYPLLEGERDHWEYRSGNMDISLNQKGLDATTEIFMTNGDQFKGQLSLPNVKLLALDNQHQSIQASAQLSMHDPGFIEAIVPEVQNMQGAMALNLSAAGTLAQPKLNGSAELLNGTLLIPRLGLTINQINMKGQSDGFEKFNFNLDARSGEGNLAIQGQTTLDRTTGWPTVLTIKGDQFEVSRIPEAQVLVSPDLQIKLQKHTIEITGDINIPYAKLQPKDISTAARVSGDTVIIGGEQPTAEKWSIVTRTRLTLGEQVHFYGFGFEGRLGGSLLLEDEPGQLTKATGEITTPEGLYHAYGQRLEVEHGRLLFTGGPLTNPGLDLRAVRHISNITAGLKVRGNLNKPQLELFSIPAMDQTDALAYLLLGRPLETTSDEEGSMMAKASLALGLSGGDRLARMLGDRFGLDEMRVKGSDSGDQTSLVMGRYLSPKLYVSYGVGLIEAINTLTVRYKISDRWQLKAESGEYQDADILYTIER